MGYINVEGLQVEVQKKRIKNMHLHVRNDGSVYVTIPRITPIREADAFVRANIEWVIKQRNKYLLRPSAEEYKSRSGELKGIIDVLLPKWENITGLKCSGYHLQYMTSRWGSCVTSTGRICFNLQLVDKPIECIEYVILHELVHLKIKGHGADFKNEISRYMPNWKEISNLLKQ